MFKHLSSKRSRSLIWIVTDVKQDWFNPLQVESPDAITQQCSGFKHTYTTCIYSSTATSSLMFFLQSTGWHVNLWWSAVFTAATNDLFKTHRFLQFCPGSTCSSLSTLGRIKKKKKHLAAGDSLFYCSVAHNGRKLGHLGCSWTLKPWWKPRGHGLGGVFALDGR